MTTSRGRRIRASLWSAYPARNRPTSGRWLPALVAAIVLLTAWWAVTASGKVAPLYLPGPEVVAARMASQLVTGVAAQYLMPTIGAALLGALFAVLIAIPLGILIAHSRGLAAVFEPYVALSQTVPLVAIAPILVLWLGYGTVPIAVLCAIVAFFPMITTTIVGLRSLDMRVVETALLDGATFPQRLWHIEGPMVAPAVLAGVRGGMALAMTGAVVGEMVMGGSGMGTLLALSRQTADTAAVFAVVAWIAVVSMLLVGLVAIAERAAVRRLQGESL